MKLKIKTPLESINKAYRNQTIPNSEINLLNDELKKVMEDLNANQDEEYHKNLISHFLRKVFYKDEYHINVNKRQDLVIRSGKNKDDSVNVIIEFKKPLSREMITKENPNVKSFHQLIYYYLEERIYNQNPKVKNLIITNLVDWYIFDEVWFSKNIFNNVQFKKDYEEFKVNKGKGTKDFYNDIAYPFLEKLDDEIPCTYFNLQSYSKFTKNQIAELYRVFSPDHLLKKPFANDSNQLNREFYNELLWIIGLEEIKIANKKIIQRLPIKERHDASLLENTIHKIQTSNKLKNFSNKNQFGETETDQIFSIGLELCITWLNRILFLKLLEGQLRSYHKNINPNFSFLNTEKIQNYSELSELFFEVLAVPIRNRTNIFIDKFKDIPYLNSSLFDKSYLEENFLSISDLTNRAELPLYNSTVLKNNLGKKITGKKNTLSYLFDFLDSYDFSSDKNSEIEGDQKAIINASVLGLIFEKINGYKDGSFFTPGFITMHMCRETIRKAVLQKFNESNNWDCKDFESLKDKIDGTNEEERERANLIINTLRICDPAVGSGHFLVSAMNEIISIKSDLNVLSLRNGNRLKGYKIQVNNDELKITNNETEEPFEYILNQKDKPIEELQAVQEALFHEKQTIIENCLFGVDINPKSVMICCLRLWIELLKNSYFTKESKYKELETLPNIDINIKCGNSLVSIFDLRDTEKSSDKKQIAEKKKIVNKYKDLVKKYKSTLINKEDLKKEIQIIKDSFIPFAKPSKSVHAEYFKLKEDAKLEYLMHSSETYEIAKQNRKRLSELEKKIGNEFKEIYSNALEWRFEFPEVLDENGDFIGFNVIIGNPPYIGIEDISWDYRRFYETIFNTAKGRFDSYSLFIEKAMQLKKTSGSFTFIIPGKFLNNKQFVLARKIICDNHGVSVIKIDDKVFEDAQVDSVIVENYPVSKQNKPKYKAFNINMQELKLLSQTDIDNILEDKQIIFRLEINSKFENIISKIETNTLRVKDIGEVKDGIVAGAIKDILFLDKKIDKDSHKLYFGKNISRFHLGKTETWVNYKPEEMMKEEIKRQGNKRTGLWMRDKKIFERDKIIYRKVGKELIATYAEEGIYYEQTVHSCHITDSRFKTKYILGLFNSTLFKFYYRNTNSQGGDIFPQVRISSVENLPIKLADKNTQESIESIVNQIIKKKSTDALTDTTDLENKIDSLVYKIYDLTDIEIKIIEKNI